ncbi:MAG TPA: hypothetical protein VFB62_07410, partial [Polyangiaceae bacterium]|nr:hypothetical protein [Polyangiaceae bacterium]
QSIMIHWGGLMRLHAIGLVAVLPLLAGCGPSLGFAYMSKDSSGDLKATRFHSVGDEIHCVMEVLGGNEETVLTMGFFGPGGVGLSDDEYYPRPDPKVQGPVPVDIQLYQLDQMGMELWDGPWPLGAYAIEIYLDHELEETLDFEVVE